MSDRPSYAQLTARVLSTAQGPLTLDETLARVEQIRAVTTRNPRATIQGAISSLPLATTLGGRPPRYAWWPHHLTGSTFRQPLDASDLSSGTLVLTKETWLALWPDFYAGTDRSPGKVTLELADGPVLETSVVHLVHGEAIWGLPPTLALATWYRHVGAAPGDDLIVHVVDVTARRYAIELVRRAECDEAAVAARNLALAEVAERLLRQGRGEIGDSLLIPRLVANDVYHHLVPPEPWVQALRDDLRFVIYQDRDLHLVERLVNSLEREMNVPVDPFGLPRPKGRWHKAETEAECRAWADHLFDHGMEYRWVGDDFASEAYYRAALQLDPGHADAWVHIGNCLFDEGLVTEALTNYRRGQAAAETRTIGDPEAYTRPFWGNHDGRPFMRALHGQGLCLWRLGQVDEAREVFAWMLKLNPDDNQGSRFLLRDLDEGLSWEESVARDETDG